MQKDFYYIDISGNVVFTKKFHINRGVCCGNKCKHCPFVPRHTKGATKLLEDECVNQKINKK